MVRSRNKKPFLKAKNKQREGRMGMFIPGHVLCMPRERGIKRNRPYHAQPAKSPALPFFVFVVSKIFEILVSFENMQHLHMPQSRRHERPRSSNLDHSASFRASNPNKASMTLMLAAASICATDALERHLAPPGFECCERDLLGC